MRRHAPGFTLIEMVIVLIVIGLLTAGSAPLIVRQFSTAMAQRDRQALDNARIALVNYAITFGGIPDPLPIDANGGLAPSFTYKTTEAAAKVVGLMPPADVNTYAVPAFGVNNAGVNGGMTSTRYVFRLDVNDHLKASYIHWLSEGSVSTYDTYLSNNSSSSNSTQIAAHQEGDRVIFCQVVSEQMALQAAANGPRICQDTQSRTVGASTTACASTIPAAMVLMSLGSNRRADQENDDPTVSANALKSNRIYENDSRGINNTPGNDQYDDQVMSYPLSAFARDCREKMAIAPEAMSCQPGYKYVGAITNNFTTALNYAFNRPTAPPATPTPPALPGTGTAQPNATIIINACLYRSDTLTVGVTTQTNNVAAMDKNNDGRVDIMLTSASGATSQ